MYIPPSFRMSDPEKLEAFLAAYSFATLVSDDDGVPFASHLPMRFHPDGGTLGTLVSHMARANPQWQHFQPGRELLAIFQGPHSYISPSWYKSTPSVPTWNYAAVHVYGVATILDDHERVVSLLNETVTVYESAFDTPWTGDLPVEFRDKLMHSIVAFEVSISRIEGKFKLGQNRSDDDVQGVIDALRQSPRWSGRDLAEFMQAHGTRSDSTRMESTRPRKPLLEE